MSTAPFDPPSESDRADAPRERLSVEVESGPPRSRARVFGEIDLDVENELHEELFAALDAGATGLDLDLSAVTFCGGSGLHLLLALNSRAAETGKTLVLTAVSRYVSRVLDITGVRRLLTIREQHDPHPVGGRDQLTPGRQPIGPPPRAGLREPVLSSAMGMMAIAPCFACQVKQLLRAAAWAWRPALDVATALVNCSYGVPLPVGLQAALDTTVRSARTAALTDSLPLGSTWQPNPADAERAVRLLCEVRARLKAVLADETAHRAMEDALRTLYALMAQPRPPS
ncbi:STAS domain-containing protein [Streptomyces lavendulae]|uniref:STAS domain-containing protein n=1 Tax=Streptomyces lavendulae TaxID=1914 RepID=UPI0033FF2CBB